MERKKRFTPPPAIGASALLVIFAVLALTVFALLSLSTAQAEKRLGDASLQAITDYYEADYQAEVIFARLRSGELPPQVQRTGSTYAYSCPVSENQQLMVEVCCSGGEWSVLRWQTVSTVEPEGDDTLVVWDGE